MKRTGFVTLRTSRAKRLGVRCPATSASHARDSGKVASRNTPRRSAARLAYCQHASVGPVPEGKRTALVPSSTRHHVRNWRCERPRSASDDGTSVTRTRWVSLVPRADHHLIGKSKKPFPSKASSYGPKLVTPLPPVALTSTSPAQL